MKQFSKYTINKVVKHLKEIYNIEQTKGFDEDTHLPINDFWYYDYCNQEETDYFQFVITPDGFRMEGSNAPDMIGQYTPDQFEDLDDILICIDNELKYYLPIPQMIKVCSECSSTDVVEERMVCYDINNPSKIINSCFSGYYCNSCEDEAKIIEVVK